jgi:hypothetical protein
MHKFWGSNQHFIQGFGFTEVLVISQIWFHRGFGNQHFIEDLVSQVEKSFLRFGFTCLVYQIDWFPQVWSHRFGLLAWFPIWFDVSGSALHRNSTFCVYIS